MKFAFAILFWLLLAAAGKMVTLMPSDTMLFLYTAIYFSFIHSWAFVPVFNKEAENEKEERLIEQGKRLMVVSLIGDIFSVDITDEAMKPTGVKHGDRLIDPFGRKLTAVGVGPCTKRGKKKKEIVFWGEWDCAKGKVQSWYNYNPKLVNLKREGFWRWKEDD